MRTLVRALVATLVLGAGAFAATASGASPQVSITAGTNPVTEGASAAFTLTRTGSSADALIVNLNVAETGAMLAGTPPGAVTFAIGSTTAGLVLATGDDEVAEAASVVTAVLAAGNGYTVDASAASATVTVEDDDAAPVVTSDLPEEVQENRVAIGTLTATDADTDVADLVWSVVGGLDAGRVTLSVDGFLAFRTPKDFETPEDDDDGGDYEIVVQVTDGANPVDVEFKIEVTDVNDEVPVVVTASLVLVPETHLPIATFEAEDADTPATDLVWSIAGGVDGDKVTLSADGILAFRAATDFEAPHDSDRDGDYEITVRVTDGVNAVDVSLTVRVTDLLESSPLASFNLQYQNVVDQGNGTLIARLRWTAPETDPDLTAWRLEWQKIGLGELSQPWGLSESSSYTSTIRAGTTVSAGDPFSVDIRPTVSKYDFSPNVAGSNLNDMHVFRVVALRGSHEHAVSTEIGGQFDPQQYLRDRIVSVVEEHEVRSPWIRETLDYLDANGIPIRYGNSTYPGVFIYCIGVQDCTEVEIRGMVFPRLDPKEGTVAHELGHVYAIAPGLSNRAPMAIAFAYLANVFFEGEGSCSGHPELLADLISPSQPLICPTGVRAEAPRKTPPRPSESSPARWPAPSPIGFRTRTARLATQAWRISGNCSTAVAPWNGLAASRMSNSWRVHSAAIAGRISRMNTTNYSLKGFFATVGAQAIAKWHPARWPAPSPIGFRTRTARLATQAWRISGNCSTAVAPLNGLAASRMSNSWRVHSAAIAGRISRMNTTNYSLKGFFATVGATSIRTQHSGPWASGPASSSNVAQLAQ